jgi:hypothetical protein
LARLKENQDKEQKSGSGTMADLLDTAIQADKK